MEIHAAQLAEYTEAFLANPSSLEQPEVNASLILSENLFTGSDGTVPKHAKDLPVLIAPHLADSFTDMQDAVRSIVKARAYR